jgi:hypothetical protein
MKIKKRENELKLELHHVIEQRYPMLQSLLHQQVRGSGHPDMSLSGNKRTVWYEIKHATPHFESPGIQEWMCQRLEKTSRCRYIIYIDAPFEWPSGVLLSRRVVVVKPQYVVNRKGKLDFTGVCSVSDFVTTTHDHEGVAAHLFEVQMGKYA